MKVKTLTFKGASFTFRDTVTELFARNRVCLTCGGIKDYIYHIYMRCRDCGKWTELQ